MSGPSVRPVRKLRGPSCIIPRRHLPLRAKRWPARFRGVETCPGIGLGERSWRRRLKTSRCNSSARIFACSHATPATHLAALFLFMKRITPSDLIDAAEAVAQITRQSHIFIVGMASTAHSLPALGALPTDDIDLFAPDSETCFLDEVIESVGEGSAFESLHGFYVEQFGAWVLLTQPRGWMERALVMPHPDLTIRVLHPLDLLYNKLETGRKEDLAGALQILKSGAVSTDQLHRFIQAAETPEETKQAIFQNLKKVLGKAALTDTPSA